MTKWEIKWSMTTSREAESDDEAVNKDEEWMEKMFGPLIFNYISIENIWKVTE